MITQDKIEAIEAQFKEFLKEKQIKLAFEREIKRNGTYKSLKSYLERYAWHKFGPHRLVSHAFPFIYSEAGREYWLDVSNEWCNTLRG